MKYESCPYCGCENLNTNIRCDSCHKELIDLDNLLTAVKEREERVENHIEFEKEHETRYRIISLFFGIFSVIAFMLLIIIVPLLNISYVFILVFAFLITNFYIFIPSLIEKQLEKKELAKNNKKFK